MTPAPSGAARDRFELIWPRLFRARNELQQQVREIGLEGRAVGRALAA